MKLTINQEVRALLCELVTAHECINQTVAAMCAPGVSFQNAVDLGATKELQKIAILGISNRLYKALKPSSTLRSSRDSHL